jgi:ribosomal protein S21
MSFANVRLVPEPFESIERLIKKFKKECQNADIFQDYASHQAFQTEAARRRLKAHNAEGRQARVIKNLARAYGRRSR